MNKKKNFFFKHLWDFLLLFLLLGGTTFAYVRQAFDEGVESSPLTATIYFEGKEIEILDENSKNCNPFKLNEITESKEYEIQGKHGKLIIEVKTNFIRVKEAECPGQECVNEGWVGKSNHPIICAHNGIYIEIEAEDWGSIEVQ